MLEVENVPEVSPAPFVNGLVRVANDAQVPMPGRQVLNQQELRPVRVLILVDHHVPEARGIAIPDSRDLLEELDRLQQQVVEIECTGLPQRLGVERGHLCHQLLAGVPVAIGTRLGRLHPVLGMADPAERHPRRHGVLVRAQRFQRLLHDRQLVRAVVNDEVA